MAVVSPPLSKTGIWRTRYLFGRKVDWHLLGRCSIKGGGKSADKWGVKPLFLILTFGWGFFSSVGLQAANGTIVHASRKLRFSYTEALPLKDFYINLGARDGVHVGDKLTVQRIVAVRDGFNDGKIHTVPVPMGMIQIVAVGETSAIGREESSTPAASLPAFQYIGFMVGDEVLAKTDLPLGTALP